VNYRIWEGEEELPGRMIPAPVMGCVGVFQEDGLAILCVDVDSILFGIMKPWKKIWGRRRKVA
jgi:hypothetical protein